MKLIGAALVLCGAGYAWAQRRREDLRPIRVGRALLGELAVLRYQICVLRRPLPDLLEGELTEGLGAAVFWGPLLARIREAGQVGASLPECWRSAALGLPPPLGRILAPLGTLLPVGGSRLDAAIEETREELAGFLRQETGRQAQRGRISAAVCLSGALLLILVLI